MLPKAQVAHHTAGRTRLRMAKGRGNGAYLTAAGRQLEEIPGIERATINPTTGSILLEHSLGLGGLKKLGRDRGLFLIEGPPPPEPVSKAVTGKISGLFRQIDQSVRSLSGGELEGRTIVAGGLLGLAAFQMRRKDFLPAGMVLLLMAFDVAKR